MLAFALLVVWCAAATGTDIERDLRRRATAALTQGDLRTVGVDFSGRDATLFGSVDSEADRAAAEKVVGTVRGVRHVRNRLVISPSADPAPAVRTGPWI